jgi:hypothetical protein
VAVISSVAFKLIEPKVRIEGSLKEMENTMGKIP